MTSNAFFSRGCGSGEVGVSEKRLETVDCFHCEGSGSGQLLCTERLHTYHIRSHTQNEDSRIGLQAMTGQTSESSGCLLTSPGMD